MPSPHRLQDVAEVPYPPTPWDMRGQIWMGTFKTDNPIALPPGLNHLYDSRSLLVVLVRYLEGTLSYDELALCVLVRRGWHMGVYNDYIWVNSLPSLWGGRRIWGIPKNMGEFVWEGNTVRVSDDQGLIAKLGVDLTPGQGLTLQVPGSGLGQLPDNTWAFYTGKLSLRLGQSNLHLLEWSPRFAYRPKDQPFFTFAGKPFHLRLPAPKIIGS